MTIRDFMNAVISAETVSDEMREFAMDEIEKLNERNRKRAEKPSKTALANEPIKVELFELLKESGEILPAAAVVEKLDGKYSVQKVSALLRQLENEGKVESFEVKVKGKGKQKGYAVKEEESEE